MSATIMPQDCIADICSLARANGVYALTYADTQIAAESDISWIYYASKVQSAYNVLEVYPVYLCDSLSI